MSLNFKVCVGGRRRMVVKCAFGFWSNIVWKVDFECQGIMSPWGGLTSQLQWTKVDVSYLEWPFWVQ